MLKPDFNELVAFKNVKSQSAQLSYQSSKSVTFGGQHSPFRGQGLAFDSVREYVFGDDIRNIDWRVTARTGSPHLKIFKEERERHVIVCVDMNAAMRFGTRKTFKSVQIARIAAILGWQAIANQDRMTICLFGDVPGGAEYFASKATRKSFGSVLKRLCEQVVEQHYVSIEQMFQHMNQMTRTGSLVYFLSDFMQVDKDFQQEMHLNRLSKRADMIFISINDQADKAIYPMGMMEFCDSHSKKIRINTDSITGRKAYALQWQDNREKLYEMTSKLKIHLIELTTESDVKRELMQGLKSIARRKRR